MRPLFITLLLAVSAGCAAIEDSRIRQAVNELRQHRQAECPAPRQQIIIVTSTPTQTPATEDTR